MSAFSGLLARVKQIVSDLDGQARRDIEAELGKLESAFADVKSKVLADVTAAHPAIVAAVQAGEAAVEAEVGKLITLIEADFAA